MSRCNDRDRVPAISKSASTADQQAKELQGILQAMRASAVNLPGGHVSTSQARELEVKLEAEAEKRRCVVPPVIHT
jgi:hypothetical protein